MRNSRDEAITLSRDGCYVSRTGLAVAQRLSERGHLNAEIALVGLGVGPHSCEQVVLSDDLAWALNQRSQNVEGPRTQRNQIVVPLQPSFGQPTLVTPVVDHEWMKSIYFKDPNGLLLEYACWTRALGDDDARMQVRFTISMGGASPVTDFRDR